MVNKEMKIELMSKTLSYTLTYKPVKNINMRITGKGLCVSAPFGTSKKYIENILKDKQEYIVKNVELLGAYHQKQLFESGNTLSYLGKKYFLNIIISDRSNVYVSGDDIYVHAKNPQTAQGVYEKWLRKNAETVFSGSLDRLYPLMQKNIQKPPELKIKKLSASWGRCTPVKNTVALSLWLIKADIELIDYVVLHELCHYLHLNHSKSFYALVASIMPDYKLRKDRLSEVQIGI